MKIRFFWQRFVTSAVFAGMIVFTGVFLAFSLLIPAEELSAAEATGKINISVNHSISMSVSNTNVNLVLSPRDEGAFDQKSTTVSVTTNNLEGCHVSMSTNSSNTALSRTVGDDQIVSLVNAAHVTSVDSTAFTTNSWGYAADGSTPESATFLPVAPLETPAVIKNINTAGEEKVPVTFAIKADSDIAAGVYSNTVVFTALANHAIEALAEFAQE